MEKAVYGSAGQASPELSVIAPVFNESANLPLFFERTKAVLESLHPDWELILVNDGSRDDSIQVIRQLAKSDRRVRYLDFSRNFGHPVAVSAGLDFALGRFVVVIDSDLQDPPELIPQLYQTLSEGFEVVYAQRRARKGEGLGKKLSARLFYRLLRLMTPVPIPLDTGDFRIMSRRVVEVLKRMPERQKFLRGQVAWVGFQQGSVLYDRDERHAGSTGYSYRRMFRLAWDAITAFSNAPLKLVTVLGFAVSIIAFLVGLYAIYARYILRDFVPGWASIMISILFIGGVQMVAIGIIGEYLSRIHANVQNRPLYILREESADPQDQA